ncbi:cysteine mitochondrial-like protein [Vairimorpha apis BRL 01]|uniref:Cysteine desulfurase, mitosomal n=1 Tax=Vairimorpha apis BRL 01 TaxID=1037528 RepID=T0L6Y7_9MICR|nr:cysteine mitochondrial-like protein [Vairimorpha apis BRL 01]
MTNISKQLTNTLNKSLNLISPNLTTPKRIYLDAQATKPLDPRVLDSMLPYYTSIFGNPHSRTHSYGWNAEKGVENARKQVADLIKADPKEIIFTSGATESGNMALKGVANFLKSENKPVHIITTQIEHKCILDTCRRLEEEGVKVTYLPVNSNGIIDLDLLKKSITKETALVSIMSVNSEMGSIQPLKEIGKICKDNNILFHTDAAQAIGNIDINVNDMNIDLLSISGHKIYGPKGVGALYIRRRPRVRILPLINGGGQERGLRSGTTPPPLVVGLGKAAEICSSEMRKDFEYIKRLSDRLKNKIFKNIENVKFNGDEKNTFPGCVNISFPYVEGEGLMMILKDIAISSGSACTSSSLEPSYVLRALGKNDDLAHSSIRFGISKFTTKKDIDRVAKETIDAVKKLREMSPLHEMVKEGIDLDKIDWSS